MGIQKNKILMTDFLTQQCSSKSANENQNEDKTKVTDAGAKNNSVSGYLLKKEVQ